jgi:hypothetical protein
MATKFWLFGFRNFPRKENSPAIILGNYALTHIVRGNVFARVGGIFSKEDHLSLVEKAKKIDIEKII